MPIPFDRPDLHCQGSGGRPGGRPGLSGCRGDSLAHGRMIAGSVAAGIVSPVVNTGIFLLGLFFLFPSFLEAWATSAGQTVLTYMIFTMVSINFALELVINLVLSTVIVRVIVQRCSADSRPTDGRSIRFGWTPFCILPRKIS